MASRKEGAAHLMQAERGTAQATKADATYRNSPHTFRADTGPGGIVTLTVQQNYTGRRQWFRFDPDQWRLLVSPGQDERYGADGQPLPRGRCDTCGAPCSPDEGTCTADPAHQTALTGDEDEDGYEGIDASMAKEDRRNAWQEGDDEDDGEYLPGTFVREGHPGDVNDPERYPDDEPMGGNESPVAEF